MKDCKIHSVLFLIYFHWFLNSKIILIKIGVVDKVNLNKWVNYINGSDKKSLNDATNQATSSIQLHNNFPKVFVSALNHCELTNLLTHSNTSTSSIIRKLMCILIPDTVWSRSDLNYSRIKNEFPDEYGSCIGKIFL